MDDDVTFSVPLDRGVHQAVRRLLEVFKKERDIQVNSIQIKWIDVTTHGEEHPSALLESVVIESEQRCL